MTNRRYMVTEGKRPLTMVNTCDWTFNTKMPYRNQNKK